MARSPAHGIPASKPFGTWIARRRQDLGIDQVAFAGRMGWSEKTQSNLENGRRPLYNDGEVLLLARELGLSEEDLRAAAAVLPAGVDVVEATPPEPIERIFQELQALRGELQEVRNLLVHGLLDPDATNLLLQAAEDAERELRSGLPAEGDEPSAPGHGRRGTKQGAEPTS